MTDFNIHGTGTTGFNTSIPPCKYCGGYHSGVCSRVKAIEFYENGAVKRVELHPNNQPPQPPDEPDMGTPAKHPVNPIIGGGSGTTGVPGGVSGAGTTITNMMIGSGTHHINATCANARIALYIDGNIRGLH